MGVYTYGEFDAVFSRPLTADELGSFIARFNALDDYGDLTAKGLSGDTRTETTQRGVLGDDWVLNDDAAGGDIGLAWVNANGITIRAEGKVYEIEQCLRAFVSWLPEDVEVTGDGEFESEGYDWGLRVEGRTVSEYDVTGIDDVQLAKFEALEAFADRLANSDNPAAEEARAILSR